MTIRLLIDSLRNIDAAEVLQEPQILKSPRTRFTPFQGESRRMSEPCEKVKEEGQWRVVF
jgi:hypothetical protein